jgi:MFS family permease
MNRSVVILRNTGHGVNDIYWYVLPSLLPIILEQFDMKYGTAGGLLTLFIGVIAVFSFILGKVSDYVSRHVVMGSGFLLASIFLIGAALMENYNYFLLCILITGIGVGSFHPAVYALIDETTEHRPGNAYGMFEFWGGVAIFFMFLLHGLLLKQLSWRTIILITSIPGLVVGSLFFSNSGKFQYTGARPVKIISNAEDFHGTQLWLFILFLVVVTSRFFSIIAIVNFTPIYLVREIGLPKNIASYTTGIYFLGALIFTPIAGRQCDIRSPFVVLLLSTLIAFPLIILISLPHPIWILPFYLFLLGGAYYGSGPAMTIIIARMGSNLGKGEAFGYFTALIAAAFSFSPLLFGILADRIGLRMSMRIFSFPLLFSVIVLFVLFTITRSDQARSNL